MQGETESKLVGRLRDGDTAALEALMERYASRVYRLACGITDIRADAEEVVQDVFLSLFRKIHTFEGRAALGSWIYRVTVNAALIKRRGKREPSPQFRVTDLADRSRTPEEELLSVETRTVLNRLIDALPDHYRAPLVLHDVEGLSNEEAARALGASVAAVKSRLHRARVSLSERLTGYLTPKPLPIQTAG